MQKDVREILRSHGLKATPNRISVLEYMLESKAHPSAEMIKDHLNSLGNSFSIGTIYNILDAFVEKGIIMKVTCDEKNFARYDANTSFHVHILDTLTNEVMDYEGSEEAELERILADIRRKNNIGDNCNILVEA